MTILYVKCGRPLMLGVYLTILGSIANVSAESQKSSASASITNIPQVEPPKENLTPTQRLTWLRSSIDTVLTAEVLLPGATIGVDITNPRTGKSLYQRQAATQFNIASATKIITLAAALKYLTPGHRFRTAMYAKDISNQGKVEGPLYVKSNADPTLFSTSLEKMVIQLKQRGIRSVSQGICIDDTYFDTDGLPPHFDEQPWEQAGFRAPVSAVSVNLNQYTIVVAPSLEKGKPATVTIDPPNNYIKIRSAKVTTVTRGRTRLRVKSTPSRRNVLVEIQGKIRHGQTPRRIRKRVESPSRYLGSVLQTMLRKHKIRLSSNAIRRCQVPSRMKRIAEHSDTPLHNALLAMGKYSVNYTAEMLLKTLGAEAAKPPGTWKKALEIVNNFLVLDVGLAIDSFRFENGSGLFSSSAFTPKQLTSVLSYAYRDFSIGPELLSSLAIAGIDGTMRSRGRRSPTAGVIRAKTGTLASVSTLAGFAGTNTAEPLAFAVFVNDLAKTRKTRATARKLQDQITLVLAYYVGATPTPPNSP